MNYNNYNIPYLVRGLSTKGNLMALISKLNVSHYGIAMTPEPSTDVQIGKTLLTEVILLWMAADG